MTIESASGDIPVGKKRTRLVRPYPVHTLEDAHVIAATIQEVNASLPFDRLLLAKALGTTPASSAYTMKLNSSSRYGLTEGGYNDERIALTHRGESVVAPQRSAERREALLEAALQPEPFRKFYEMLNSKRLPDDTYAQNALQRELGIHASLASECLRILKANGRYVGILGDVGGSVYVSLSGAHAEDGEPTAGTAEVGNVEETTPAGAHGEGKIFIGHAGAPDVVDFLKTVLDEFGIPYVAVETGHDDLRPVTEEAAREMRGCDAAILVFARPTEASGDEARDERTAEKMLYQLGAASVLYGDRVVAVAEPGLELDGRGVGFSSLEFSRGRMQELGFPLLAELHRKGLIYIRTSPQGPVHDYSGGRPSTDLQKEAAPGTPGAPS